MAQNTFQSFLMDHFIHTSSVAKNSQGDCNSATYQTISLLPSMSCFMFNTAAQLQPTIKLQCPTCITTIHVHHEMCVLFMCVHTSHSKESIIIITQIASKHFSHILYSLDMQSCKVARLPACFGPEYMIVLHLYLALSFILDVGGNLK